jgi:hypothetical protein
MNKFNYENLAIYLLNILLEEHEPFDVLQDLIYGGIETDLLLELMFSIDDIELTKKEIEKERKNYE